MSAPQLPTRTERLVFTWLTGASLVALCWLVWQASMLCADLGAWVLTRTEGVL